MTSLIHHDLSLTAVQPKATFIKKQLKLIEIKLRLGYILAFNVYHELIFVVLDVLISAAIFRWDCATSCFQLHSCPYHQII